MSRTVVIGGGDAFVLAFSPLPPLPHEMGAEPPAAPAAAAAASESPTAPVAVQHSKRPRRRENHAGVLSEFGGVRAWLDGASNKRRRVQK